MPEVVLAAAVLVPGILVTAAFFAPAEISLPGRVALAYAAGFVTVSFSAWILICFGALKVWSFSLVVCLVSLAAAVVALRRGSLRDHGAHIKSEFRNDPYALLLGVAVLIAVGWAFSDASGLFSFGNTSMRFFGDGVEIADAGGIPDSTIQWGTAREPATSKMFLNSFTAATALIVSDPLPAISASTWLAAIFLSATVWWLGWELGLRWLAPLLALLTSANVVILRTEMTFDLLPYRAETFGRVLAFSGIALSIASLRARAQWPSYLLAGILFGFAAGTHLVPTMVCCALLGGYCVALIVRKQPTRPLLVRLVALLATAGAILLLAWVTPGANLGFEGTLKSDAGVSSNVDQTALFDTGKRVSLSKIREKTWYRNPTKLMSDLVNVMTDFRTSSPWPWIGSILAALVAAAILAPPSLRDGPALGAALLTAIVAMTLAFDRFYDSFALALFGKRRLFDYGVIPVWLLILTAGAIGLYALQRFHRLFAPALAAAITLGIATALLPDLRAVQPSSDSRSEIEELEWLRDNTACDDRILSNYRSGGSYQVLAGRVLVNEGMGPFFRPVLLQEVNEFLRAMNAFFLDPAQGHDFLSEQGVDYVVMVRGPGGADLPPRTAPGFPPLMEKAPFLEHVFTGRRANIYRVTDVTSSGDFPDPADHAGYECERGPIRV